MKRRFLVGSDSPYAEPLRALRLAIESRTTTSEIRGMLFASPRRGDGRSTLAANYAVVTALVQRPVLLIDADMRNPSLHDMFGVSRSPGLVDALQDRLDPWKVAHVFPSLGGLHVLTAGSASSQPGDIVTSSAMSTLLQRAYEEYDAVILDSPPTLIAADASGLASHPGTGVVMVVNRSGKRRHVMSALRRLAITDAKILGLAVNREGTLVTDLQ